MVHRSDSSKEVRQPMPRDLPPVSSGGGIATNTMDTIATTAMITIVDPAGFTVSCVISWLSKFKSRLKADDYLFFIFKRPRAIYVLYIKLIIFLGYYTMAP